MYVTYSDVSVMPKFNKTLTRLGEWAEGVSYTRGISDPRRPRLAASIGLQCVHNNSINPIYTIKGLILYTQLRDHISSQRSVVGGQWSVVNPAGKLIIVETGDDYVTKLTNCFPTSGDRAIC